MTDSALLNSFVQARHYTPGGNLPPTRIVVHDEEYQDKPTAAEEIAAFFAGPNAPQASAHAAVDNNSIVGCVHEADTAWHAPPNKGSLGIEHSGYSSQSADTWADPYNEAMLCLSAKLCADWCRRYDIPVVWLSVDDLLAGKRGITSHNNVSQAWHQSDHSDPGPNFPVAHYLELVNAELSPQPQPGPTPQEHDVPIICRPVPDAPGNPNNNPEVGGEFVLAGNVLIALATPDEAQQYRNSGLETHDFETLAWANLKKGCTIVR